MPRYIHERPEWTDFFFERTALLPLLVQVSHRQGRFIGRMETLESNARNQAQAAAITEEIVNTNAIEGESVHRDQVYSAVLYHLGMDVTGLPAPERKIDGVVQMMMDAGINGHVSLTEERLFGWHHALFPMSWSNHGKITVAKWRTGHMEVVSGSAGNNKVHYEAPVAERVPREMLRFLEWHNRTPEDFDPILRAALAHFWFVTIHPFEDGNGRIARAIGDGALMVADKHPQRFYSLSAQIYRERSAYYDILEKTQHQQTSDMTGWYHWFLQCLDRALVSADKYSKHTMLRQIFWDALPQAEYSEHQREILQVLLDGFPGKFTAHRWASITGVSPQTSLRDIRQLTKLGILEQEGKTSRSTSYRLGVKPVMEKFRIERRNSPALSWLFSPLGSQFASIQNLTEGMGLQAERDDKGQLNSVEEFYERLTEIAVEHNLILS